MSIENYFRMPNCSCKFKHFPARDHRDESISDRIVYLELCQYYDRFKMSFDEYQSSNWVPDKEEFPINFGVHYLCHKQNRATFECLLAFRSYYPEVPIILVSDNGNNFRKMAEYFGCHYIHEAEQTGNGITNVLRNNDSINLWLYRIKRTCNILQNVDYILYMEDDVVTRSKITKNPNADIAGPSNPDDFWWSPQIIQYLKDRNPNIEINGLNGCGGTIFGRKAFLECFDNMPNYRELSKLDNRLGWASDVIITFLFLYNNKVSRRWLDQSEESRGKIFGSTAFDHQNKFYYNKKWNDHYLGNIELDDEQNFIFTACSDNIFKYQFIPFYASLKENTTFNGSLIVIDYGLSNNNLQILINNGIRVIPSIGKYEIVSDRFLSMNRYIQLLCDTNKIFAHFDCDIWFDKDINQIFDISRESANALCTKDVWHCGFLHDCVAKEEHKEYNRNVLFGIERKCGKVLQAGFICGNQHFWREYSEYLGKLLTGYLKDVYGADELALNLMFYYWDHICVLPIGYNALPQWGIKDVGGELVATDFHTDLHWSGKNHRESVLAVHFSSAVRGKEEYRHIDFKTRHKDLYDKYVEKLYKSERFEKSEIVERFGFRYSFPTMLNLLNVEKLCEIGVCHGGNLFNMANSDVGEIWGVDIWKVTQNKSQNDVGLTQAEYNEIYDKVSKIAKEKGINIIRDFSSNACKQFPDSYFDFVYIDADHSYEGCLQDIQNWLTKNKNGGILAGDDYVDAVSPVGTKFGVIEAVNEFVAAINNYNLIHTRGKDNKGSSPQWFLLK